jgi:hypothetical protein
MLCLASRSVLLLSSMLLPSGPLSLGMAITWLQQPVLFSTLGLPGVERTQTPGLPLVQVQRWQCDGGLHKEAIDPAQSHPSPAKKHLGGRRALPVCVT